MKRRSSTPERRALAVMVKPPLPGLVKTRLTPPLTPEEAAGLYRSFLIDLFANLRRADLEMETFIAGAPPACPEDFNGIMPEGAGFFRQEGQGLGERIFNVFKMLEIKGFSRAVVIGGDSPDLPAPFIEEAGAILSGPRADLVIGPAHDGGYYLIGAPLPISGAIFNDIQWGGSAVLEQTLERAREAGLRVRLLEPWHDIDRPEDLALLALGQGAPESRAFVEALAPRPGLLTSIRPARENNGA